jgi:hypothetical protein
MFSAIVDNVFPKTLAEAEGGERRAVFAPFFL